MDQLAHLGSLVKIFADHICLLQPLGYPKRNKQEPLPYWEDVQADPSLCWAYRSYCKFCHALAQMTVVGVLIFVFVLVVLALC